MEQKEQVVLAFLLEIVIVLFAIWLYLINTLPSITPQYLLIEQRAIELHNENLGLTEQLLYSESYTHIASVAATRGFAQRTFLYLR